MPKIASIEYFRVCPRWLFVKICDAEGFSGWGEATLEGHTEAVEGTLNALIKRFVGYDADDIEHLWQTAWRLGFYRGGPVLMSAISGIDIALWDMKGSGLSRSNVVGFCRVGFCSFDVISVASKDAREAALSDCAADEFADLPFPTCSPETRCSNLPAARRSCPEQAGRVRLDRRRSTQGCCECRKDSQGPGLQDRQDERDGGRRLARLPRCSRLVGRAARGRQGARARGRRRLPRPATQAHGEAAGQGARAAQAALHRGAAAVGALGGHQAAVGPHDVPDRARRAALQPLGREALPAGRLGRRAAAGHLARRRHLGDPADRVHGRGLRRLHRAALSARADRAGGVDAGRRRDPELRHPGDVHGHPLQHRGRRLRPRQLPQGPERVRGRGRLRQGPDRRRARHRRGRGRGPQGRRHRPALAAQRVLRRRRRHSRVVGPCLFALPVIFSLAGRPLGTKHGLRIHRGRRRRRLLPTRASDRSSLARSLVYSLALSSASSRYHRVRQTLSSGIVDRIRRGRVWLSRLPLFPALFPRR